MSTIAEFITGTVNESLKKLLQPVGLIPASLFVLLNLAFVYPSARSDGLDIAQTFAGLDAATQAAVVALVAFALSYFLLSTSSTILDILGGELIRGSLLHSILVWVQRRRRRHLRDLTPENDWYLSRRYYVAPVGEEERDPLPTALGNVLVATQGAVARRYGIDMAALWSQFVATPDLKDLPARSIVEDERASRDILVNMAFMLWAFALEGLVYFTLRDHPRNALLALLAVPGGYVAYRAAVAKAEAWGDAVETLFDLHRDKLHAALKLKSYKSPGEELDVWQRATRFYLHAEPETADEVFEQHATPSITAIPSGQVTAVTPASAVRDGPKRVDRAIWLRWVEVVVLVSTTGGKHVTAAEIYVDDPRVGRIEKPYPEHIPVGKVSAQAEAVPGDDGRDALLWNVGPLGGGVGISLRYELPLAVLKGARVPLPRLVAGAGFELRLSASLEQLRLTYRGTAAGRPELRRKDTRLEPTAVVNGEYRWSDVGGAGEHLWIVLPDDDAP
jgi:hypothetical protein